jgi:hypothetical protein
MLEQPRSPAQYYLPALQLVKNKKTKRKSCHSSPITAVTACSHAGDDKERRGIPNQIMREILANQHVL